MLSLTRHKETRAARAKTGTKLEGPTLRRLDLLLPWQTTVAQRERIGAAVRDALGERIANGELLVVPMAAGDGGAKRAVGVGLWTEPHGNGALAAQATDVKTLQASDGWRRDLGEALDEALRPLEGVTGEVAPVGAEHVQRVTLRAAIPEGARQAAEVDLAIALARWGVPGPLPEGAEALLAFCARQASPFTAGSAAETLGIAPADAYGLLRALEGAGFVDRMEEVGGGNPAEAEALSRAAAFARGGKRFRRGLDAAISRAARPVTDPVTHDRFAFRRVASLSIPPRLSDSEPPPAPMVECTLRGDFRSASALLGEAVSEWQGVLGELARAARDVLRQHGGGGIIGAARR